MPKEFRSHHHKSVHLMRIRDLLRGEARTAGHLLESLNASALNLEDRLELRTLQRYLQELVERWGEVEVDASRRPPVYRLTHKLNVVEALVTHSALRLLYHHTPGYNSTYASALNKLARQLPKPAQEIAIQSTQEHKNKGQEAGEALGLVAQAWFRRQRIAFDYRKPGGSGQERHNELDVYFIEVSRANLGLYVIGYEHGYHRAVRTFKLDRMRRVKLMGEAEAYKIPQDFDPRKFLSNAWGVVGSSGGEPAQVRLRFQPEAAYRIEEAGYPAMERIYLSDGRVEVRFEVGTNKQNFPVELLSWVQGWGPRVEVLEPESLRQRWLEEARQILDAYGGCHD
jgi:predicted DNA-binding transcriptional regulator YafY